jgi:hypothetical protein
MLRRLLIAVLALTLAGGPIFADNDKGESDKGGGRGESDKGGGGKGEGKGGGRGGGEGAGSPDRGGSSGPGQGGGRPGGGIGGTGSSGAVGRSDGLSTGAGGLGGPSLGASTTGSLQRSLEEGPRGADESLPRSLTPVFLGAVFSPPERLRSLGALRGRPGTPVSMVQACRARIGRAGQRYGAVRVDAVGAGPTRLRRNGVRVAPIEVRIVYERGGHVEVRQSAAMCHVSADGRVTAIR